MKKKDVIIVVFGIVNLTIWKYLKYIRYFRIEYSIDNEVYICKKYPKLVIDDINKNKINLLVATISIIVRVVQLLVL